MNSVDVDGDRSHDLRMKAERRKIVVLTVGGLTLFYLGSYLALAFGGGYTFAASGKFRPINHLASTDMMVWQPRVGTFYSYRNAIGDDTYQSDWIGCTYAPLILLHQAFVAPSIRTIDSSGAVRPEGVPLPQRHQLHPAMIRELPELERTFGLTWEQMAVKLAAGQGILE